MTFKKFKQQVEYMSERLNIPMDELLKWTLKDFRMAYELIQ